MTPLSTIATPTLWVVTLAAVAVLLATAVKVLRDALSKFVHLGFGLAAILGADPRHPGTVTVTSLAANRRTARTELYETAAP